MHLSWSVCLFMLHFSVADCDVMESYGVHAYVCSRLITRGLFMLHFSVADWDVMETYGGHVYVCSRLITRGLFMLHFTVADGVVWCACVCVFTPHHTCYLT